VIAAVRLRGGNAGSARGAASLLAQALATAKAAGARGMILVRADSAYYAGALVSAARRGWRDVLHHRVGALPRCGARS
jgi:hypothetical protein